MKMNLKVLGLGVVLSLSCILPACANQDTQISVTKSFKKSKIEVKQLTQEERIKRLEESIQNLEKNMNKD